MCAAYNKANDLRLSYFSQLIYVQVLNSHVFLGFFFFGRENHVFLVNLYKCVSLLKSKSWWPKQITQMDTKNN